LKFKSLRVAAVLALAVVLIFGAMTLEVQAEGRELPDEVEIAFVAPRLDITEFFGQFYDEMRIQLDESGLNYSVMEAAPPGAQMDHEGLDAILGDIRSFGPDYLVFVISEWHTVEPRVREIIDEGVHVLLVDHIPEHTDVQPIAWLATDHVESGYITGYAAAEHFAEIGQDHVNIALFHGTAGGEVGIDRMNGYQAGFADGAEDFGLTYEIVEEVWTEFDREQAFNVSQNVALAHDDLDLVLAANSATALGVMDGFRNLGVLDEIEITGIGGQLEELASIIQGDILTAGVRIARAQGAEGAKMLLEHMRRGGAADLQNLNYGYQTVVWDAEDIFEAYSIGMLDHPEFRNNLPEGVWEEYAGE